MLKQGCFYLLATLAINFLFSCSGSSLWTGATMVYDRHDVYKKIDDYYLYVHINNAITVDPLFKNCNCALDIAVFNGDILVTGHVPTAEMQEELHHRLNTVKGYRRMFDEVKVSNISSSSIQDGWITTKIRSQIFADATIDPNAFKVVTSDGVVYLMGDVRPSEAKKVIYIARHTVGVAHVVKVFKYLVYQQ
ncbi:MAG: BON domain-containing protein [Legionella sp.]|uniref:BON domain-containing protein n=1 Tax=Legionella sp. TaxID=459 RepID=UPI0039E393AB